ncbi:sodium:proton antiporter [Micromonospora halophytica]|uniref:Multisubunit sodium/proton antiporter, MrpC subunit n=1 Tax=Micromonospora halophytica TaxID=47864 RepID=A0A1C5GVM0_9ACTN|nr:NADH-quinone oxidoreductase subunit K [Micromonospora halophytica]SCG37825.1 multisubunit sodium/proton antiporter, MrpC subunit [Micromonospora halophytica]
MTAAVAVGVLVAAAVHLLLQRGQLRVILGFVLLGHAVNVLLLSAGGLDRRTPAFDGAGEDTADPLPQAFALTAIVISFGITLYLLGLLRADVPAGDGGEEETADGRSAAEGGEGGDER